MPTKTLLLIAALLAGCASSTRTAGGEGCVKTGEFVAVTSSGAVLQAGRCVEWSFGPTHPQMQAHQEAKRAVDWWK